MNAERNELRPLTKGCLSGVLVILAAYVLCFAFQTRDYFIDDAYIDFQYIRNLLAGQGFVFQPGLPAVEGVTNVGWLLFLLPFAALAGPPLAAKLVGLILLLACLILTACTGWRLATRSGTRPRLVGLAAVPVILLAFSFDFVYFSLAGMETALLATILLLMAWIAMSRPTSLLLPVLGAFAFLVHPEAVAVYPCYCLLLLGTTDLKGRRLWQGNLLLAALVVAATLIRYACFRDVVPNTFHSKPSSWFQIVFNAQQALMGRNTNIPFPLTGWLALGLLVLGYFRLRRARPAPAAMLAATAGIGLAFCVYSLPDWTATGRYFAPYLPAALLLFWAGVLQIVGLLLRRSSIPAVRQAAAAAVAALLVICSLFYGKAKMAQMDTFPGYVLASKNLIEPSQWIRDHLPRQATIATRRIGALAYHGERTIFDYTFGLADRQVARQVAAAGRRFDSPTDPALAALWSDRSPDYLLEDANMIDYIVSKAGGSRQHFSIHGLHYAVMKSFPIGRDKRWVLAQRIARD